ncbi:beta-mannosidase [Ixodes scapularis]
MRRCFNHSFPLLQMSSLVQVVSAKNLSELLSSASCSRNNSFLTFRLSNDSDGETLSSNFLLLQVPRLATEIPSAALKISNVSALHSEDESLRGSNVHEIELKTDAVALFVWLSAGRVRGRFSDNGFIMVDKTTSLTFTSDLPLDVAQLRLNISGSVRSEAGAGSVDAGVRSGAPLGRPKARPKQRMLHGASESGHCTEAPSPRAWMAACRCCWRCGPTPRCPHRLHLDLKADDQTPDSARQKILLTMGKEETGNGD